MDPAWAALAAVASPLVLVTFNRYFDRSAKREDWRRQDEVAAKAAAAVEKFSASQHVLAYQQEQAARHTIEVASRAEATRVALLASNQQAALAAAEAVQDVKARLVQIHTLVNSELMEAQRRELAALELTLMMSREVVDLKRSRGEEPGVSTEDNLLEMEIRIKGMRDGLDAKAAETEAAAAERAAMDTSPA